MSIGGTDVLVNLEIPDVNQDLKAHWRFDEGQGFETRDSAGNSGLAQLQGGVTWNNSHASEFGTAVSLEGNEFSYIELGTDGERKVTRREDLLGWFKFDEQVGETTANLGSDGSSATLVNGATFSGIEKKFGASSLHFPENNQNAFARIDNPIEVGPNNQSMNYSLSVWFKGLYNNIENSSGWRTLTRGSSANHQILINYNSDEIGTHSGWVGSGSNLTPSHSAETWQHLAASFNGTSTQIYIDGSSVGNINASKGNNIYAIGNRQNGGQRFSRFLDDFRVYGITLDNDDVSAIYNSGNGDYPDENDSLMIGNEMTISGWFKLRSFGENLRMIDFGDFSEGKESNTIILGTAGFGNEGNLTISNGSESKSTIVPNFWKLDEWQHISVTVDENGTTKFFSDNEYVGSYEGNVPTRTKRSHHIIGGNRFGFGDFEVSEIPGITLWLDASDSSTITSSGLDVNSWANKVNAEVRMYPGFGGVNGSPSTDGKINEMNAIIFNSNERLQAKLNSSTGIAWNPLGENGSTNSNYDDFAIFLVTTFTNAVWNNGPFNIGWQGHIPGAHADGYLFWDYPEHGNTRMQTNINTNTPYLLTFYGSTTLNERILGGMEMNYSELLAGKR